jgi:hypothetical protein
MSDLILVKTVITRQEAEIIKGFLLAQEIWSFSTTDDRGGASPYPFSPTPTGVQIFCKTN